MNSTHPSHRAPRQRSGTAPRVAAAPRRTQADRQTVTDGGRLPRNNKQHLIHSFGHAPSRAPPAPERKGPTTATRPHTDSNTSFIVKVRLACRTERGGWAAQARGTGGGQRLGAGHHRPPVRGRAAARQPYHPPRHRDLTETTGAMPPTLRAALREMGKGARAGHDSTCYGVLHAAAAMSFRLSVGIVP